MTLQQAARVLTAVGALYVTVENIRRAMKAGAPRAKIACHVVRACASAPYFK
jgi:hypothetical protein